ncbi:hypothetical protein HAX54_005294 [Datura stramonium]|uniref:Uncharacterized protein n=1 Tax=Datura stramonium TaxID=4076 RepID=A0ABS8RU30_DATST|nr:hypothetical protein [Datura stramonium]
MEKNPKMTKEFLSDSMLRKSVIWDCESSLYDSFELKSFERQLDRAIASRTMSMPHLLSSSRVVPISSSSQYSQSYHMSGSKGSKISRSFQKIIKSVFRSKHSSPFSPVQEAKSSNERRSNALSPISGVAEYDIGHSTLDIKSSLERRIKSTRFTATTSS